MNNCERREEVEENGCNTRILGWEKQNKITLSNNSECFSILVRDLGIMYYNIFNLRTTSILQMQVWKNGNVRIVEYLVADEHASFSS